MKKFLSIVAVGVLSFTTIIGSVSADTDVEGEKTTEAEVSFEGGILTLDSVPSSIAFGSRNIESGEGVYDSTTLEPSLQVTDLRGTGEGWKVTAKMSNFTDEDEQHSLSGSTIDIINGKVESISISDKPEPSSSIHLKPGLDADTVVVAAVDAGRDKWTTSWSPTGEEKEGENSSIRLTVPAGSVTKDAHSATITWTLHNTP